MRAIPWEPVLGLIHMFEGRAGAFEPVRTHDPVGNLEIGWSHKLSGAADPLWNARLDAQGADDLAKQDLTKVAMAISSALIGQGGTPAIMTHDEANVAMRVMADPGSASALDALTEGQYAALIDFGYNVGIMHLLASTLFHFVKAGNLARVPEEFMKWVYAHENGEAIVLPGLVNRRKAEVAVWQQNPAAAA